MGKTIKIVFMVIIMLTMGETKDGLENIVKEMNERLVSTEEKLMNTHNDCVRNQDEQKKTQEELKKTQEVVLELQTRNIQLEERIRIAEDDQCATKDDLTATKNALNTKDQELEMDVSFLKNPPFFHACGARHGWLSHITSQTISYSSLLYSSTNTEGGDLNIASGVFTCPYPGSYSVTWSLMAKDHSDDKTSTVIYLRQNGQDIEESVYYSHYTGSTGYVQDLGKYNYIYNDNKYS
jgi:hypothetical protein